MTDLIIRLTLNWDCCTRISKNYARGCSTKKPWCSQTGGIWRRCIAQDNRNTCIQPPQQGTLMHLPHCHLQTPIKKLHPQHHIPVWSRNRNDERQWYSALSNLIEALWSNTNSTWSIGMHPKTCHRKAAAVVQTSFPKSHLRRTLHEQNQHMEKHEKHSTCGIPIAYNRKRHLDKVIWMRWAKSI